MELNSTILFGQALFGYGLSALGIITDELLLNPWDREVFRNGDFHFNPEYAEALVHQGVEAKAELLIPAKVFRLAKE